MNVDRNKGKPGANADTVHPSNDPDPVNVARVVEPQGPGGAKKAMQ